MKSIKVPARTGYFAVKAAAEAHPRLKFHTDRITTDITMVTGSARFLNTVRQELQKRGVTEV